MERRTPAAAAGGVVEDAVAGARRAAEAEVPAPEQRSQEQEDRLETLAEEETGERSGERALSRLIQRDARRYDGGFSLY